MKLLFLLSHPAHYHLFKNIISKFEGKNHEILILIRPKDVLEELVRSSGMKFLKVAEKERKSGKFMMLFSLLLKEIKIMKIANRFKPDFMIGSDASLAHVGFLLSIPSFEFCEDDEKVIKLYARIAFPFFTKIIAPINCNLGKWESKKIAYKGYHESAFLTPKYFQPDEKILNKYNIQRPYCILRFSKLGAYHDNKISGISDNTALKIISKLAKSYAIYITSEKKLSKEFEKFRLFINPLDIHHILYYSELLVSDSQSMTMEAAVLGAPSLRISSFVGRISVLEELEHKYNMTFGINPEEADKKVESIIDKILSLKKEINFFGQKRDMMLNDKIDLVDFVVQFFENYQAQK